MIIHKFYTDIKITGKHINSCYLLHEKVSRSLNLINYTVVKTNKPSSFSYSLSKYHNQSTP